MRPTKIVTVQLDRERRLAFDFNALRYMHDVAGVNVLEDGLNLEEFRTPGKMLALFTAMLQSDAKRAGETLTEDQVGELLDFEGILEMTRAVQAVVGESAPEQPANPPKAAAPSPGSSSGPSAASTSACPIPSSGS